MPMLFGHDVPDITVTKDGTTYRLPVQLTGREGDLRPVPVARSPKMAFPPPLAIAGPEGGQFRRNYDIDELIQTTWEGGMGDDTVAPGTEVRGYQWGRCDTRWPNVLTNRPLATQLGSNITGGALQIHKVVELNYTNAQLLHYSRLGTSWRYTGSAWTTVQAGGVDISTTFQHALGTNGVVLAGSNGVNTIHRSADGVTWDGMAAGAMSSPNAVAIFDDKVWALDNVATGGGSANRRVFTVYSSADLFSAAGGAGTWTAGAQTVCPAKELPVKLFVWQYPLDRGKPTLWLLTNSRLLYYDYYANTPAWREWFVLRTPQQANASYTVDAVVAPTNGNLYVCVYGKEWIWEFTGNTIERPSPNKRHGLPAGTRLTAAVLDANESGVYAFCRAMPGDSSSKGAVVWMDDGKSFHHLYDQTAYEMYGGGVGSGKVWGSALNPSNYTQVFELLNPEILAVPPQVTGRTFDTAANTLQSGWLRMGLANTNKRLLQFEIDCIKSDGTVGLESGATVQVEYRGRGSASWTSAGTLTDASTFPAVLAISGGWTFKEMQYRLTLTAGSSTTPALVRAVKLGYRPRPKQRYTYTARVDLRDDSPAFRTTDGKYHGYTASKLRELIDEWVDNDDLGLDDTLVGLGYGGYGNLLHPRRRSATQCELSVQSQESPDGGDGLLLLIFNSVDASTSG